MIAAEDRRMTIEARVRLHSPFLYVYMDCGPMLARTDIIPMSGHLRVDRRCLLQDGEEWGFTFGPGRRCTVNASQSH